jgi:ABC transport system ATP-binding/permease protein
MSQLLSANQLTQSFAARTLFKGVSLGIDEGDRIGLVGPNGAGKSTLLKILSKQMKPDEGTVVYRRGLTVGILDQAPQFKPGENLWDALLSKTLDPIESSAKAYEWLSKLELDQFQPDIEVANLSGGWKKRLALARELMTDPEVLLLDEPTNHLDVASILWLENFLAESSIATVTITHDRLFLQRVANKIFDLDRRNPNHLLVVDGDYLKYLEAKELMIQGEQHREWTMKNTLRRETEWLRRGAKARLTKQKARIERAHDLKSEVEDLSGRNKMRNVEIEFKDSERTPKKLIDAVKICKSYGDKVLVKDFTSLISPKTRMGLLGKNGVGKSTLIRLLLNQESPDQGTVKHADDIKISYFEQNRETLNPKLSLIKNICSDGDYVNDRGNFVYARSYLQRFLFSNEQMDLPVEKLSGGEQSRLRLAQLMLLPASVLVLDEPTNELDMETLQVLEESLKAFPGAVIIVTHDRYFMDQVANEIWAFGQNGDIQKFADYLQWEDWNFQQEQELKTKAREEKQQQKSKTKKISYKDKLELEGMEPKILGLETEVEALQAETMKPENAANAKKLTELSTLIGEKQIQIEALYARWNELSAGQKGNP